VLPLELKPRHERLTKTVFDPTMTQWMQPKKNQMDNVCINRREVVYPCAVGIRSRLQPGSVRSSLPTRTWCRYSPNALGSSSTRITTALIPGFMTQTFVSEANRFLLVMVACGFTS